MYRGFPRKLLDLLRCPSDGGALVPGEASPPDFVPDLLLGCAACRRTYAVQNGIVCLLDPSALDTESERERSERDSGARNIDHFQETSAFDEMELAPTLEAAEPLLYTQVLELGVGTGRLTVRMAERGASIVAVDFSRVSLERLSQRIQPGWEIGLVHADCTQMEVGPSSFGLVVSTLGSNLPTARHRARMMALAAKACKPSAAFVFSTHHYGFRSRMRGEAQSGRYAGGLIYRYLFRRREIKAETRAFFDEIKCHPIVISIPFAARAGLPIVKLSRLTERVPIINNFGELLLVVARRPIVPV